jgi:hypothetical protein
MLYPSVRPFYARWFAARAREVELGFPVPAQPVNDSFMKIVLG